MAAEKDVPGINRLLAHATALEALAWCYAEFPPERIKLSTSFGAEGMVLLHMLVTMGVKPRVFFIDTGRNHQETYDTWQQVVDRYGVTVESYGPEAEDLVQLQREAGPNLFYQSVENRRKCCYVRKVKPLRKALGDCDVWIAALRRGQSEARADTELFSYVADHGVYKLCPLVNWSEEDVWEYIRNNGVPYNTLYDKGYPSIGCAPCCRPVRPAEAQRASRWWWEQDAQKECGIHIENGRIVRKKEPPTWTI